jgi:hypothetical protein
MSGGGHVIIRSAVRDLADTSVVRDNCDQSKLAKLQDILAKDPASWTVFEFRFVLRRIEEAHDALV